MKKTAKTSATSSLQTLGGVEIKKMNLKKKAFIAKQVVDLLKPYVEAGYMVEQTIPGLIKYINGGLAIVSVTLDLEVIGFAKLYPYISKNSVLPLGYEFSSWISKKKGLGMEILKKSLKVFNQQNNLSAGFFAVCSSDYDIPQKKIFKVGGTLMERPYYVPNMLAIQTGENHPETIINLKEIPY